MPTAEPRGLRQAAIDWLQLRSDGGIEPLTREDILDFQFAGESVRLQAPMQGIWKPRGYAAALSFRTAYTKPGNHLHMRTRRAMTASSDTSGVEQTRIIPRTSAFERP